MKRLTIIIPVYNAANSIGRCIESILPQMSSEDELLLINDGSTDDSLKIIRDYEKKYQCIVVIDKCNEGVAATRNRGIDEAKGEYLLFIDNDDYIDSDYLKVFYREIEYGDYDCVLGGYRRISNGKILYQMESYNSEWYKLMLVAPWAKIYRTSFIKDNKVYFLDYKIGEDTYFSMLLYSKTKKIGFVNYVGYNWWYNKTSISNTVQRGFDSNVDVLYLLDRVMEISGRDKIYQFYYLRYIVWYLLFSGRTASVNEYMREYVRCFNWLEENNISTKYHIFSKMFNPESLKNRVAIKSMIILHRIKAMKIFAIIYCKR